MDEIAALLALIPASIPILIPVDELFSVAISTLKDLFAEPA